MIIYHSIIPRSQGGDFYETIAINVPIGDTLLWPTVEVQTNDTSRVSKKHLGVPDAMEVGVSDGTHSNDDDFVTG